MLINKIYVHIIIVYMYIPSLIKAFIIELYKYYKIKEYKLKNSKHKYKRILDQF